MMKETELTDYEQLLCIINGVQDFGISNGQGDLVSNEKLAKALSEQGSIIVKPLPNVRKRRYADNESREMQIEEMKAPQRLIYAGFSSHDCEAWYSCPYCNKKIGGWSLPSSGDVAKGKKMYCPHCKKEVKYPY